jgi:hypothetical protein
MADYDVSAVQLSSPPSAAPQSTYRPAVLVRNNGLFSTSATGNIQAYAAGLLVFSSSLISDPIAPGETGQAFATDDWTPEEQGDYYFFAYVTCILDQVPSNNNLPPTLVTVGPPPPPPTPATLDDVVAALQPVAQDATLNDVLAAIPEEAATEPTLEEVRDKLPLTPASDETLVEIRDKLTDDPATETTLAAANDKLAGGLPSELGESGGLKVEASVLIPVEPKTPNLLAAKGLLELSDTEPLALDFGTFLTRTIFIQADPHNTGLVLIGVNEFMLTTGEHCIAALSAGDSIGIEYENAANPIYILGSDNLQKCYAGATIRQ